ncbi:GNAT family N-acetyltransferase [Agromyces sp. MMS24-K17]|uniref:GNAT family N-acetyltransferase n=1 Tax=Agromyces sp. MMS24-K17 TaxID=3372850 RepID=UPI0037544930
MTTHESKVTRNDARQRYELHVDGEVAGIAMFREEEGRVVFTHTVVLPAYEGRGLGGTIAKTALDDVVSRGLRVVPECPFISAWIAKHPEYEASVDRS